MPCSALQSTSVAVPSSPSAAASALKAERSWREQHQRWDRLHYARVAIIIAGFVLTLVAATTLR